MPFARRVFHWAGVYGLIGVTVVVLYLGGPTTAMLPVFAGVDILLGGLFLVAFQRLRSVS